MQSPVEAPTPGVVTENPAIETASEEAGHSRSSGSGPSRRAPDRLPRRRLPFAAQFQAILIAVMFASFLLILQQWNKTLYQIGLPVLVVAAFLQIAFGNIPPASGFRKSMGLLALTWAIVAVLVIVAVQITPSLIQLGKHS